MFATFDTFMSLVSSRYYGDWLSGYALISFKIVIDVAAMKETYGYCPIGKKNKSADNIVALMSLN